MSKKRATPEPIPAWGIATRAGRWGRMAPECGRDLFITLYEDRAKVARHSREEVIPVLVIPHPDRWTVRPKKERRKR